MKKLLITIGPTGEPTIVAEGFTGTSCKDATKAITDAVMDGSQIDEEAPEFHMLEEEGTESEYA